MEGEVAHSSSRGEALALASGRLQGTPLVYSVLRPPVERLREGAAGDQEQVEPLGQEQPGLDAAIGQ